MTKLNRILIVDDDIISSISLKAMVTETQLFKEIFIHNSALTAIDFLKHSTKDNFPKVILVDLMMPIMDGFEFIHYFEQYFASNHPDTQLIVVTNSRAEADKQKAMSYSSVQSFINKPVHKEIFEPCIQPLSEKLKSSEAEMFL